MVEWLHPSRTAAAQRRGAPGGDGRHRAAGGPGRPVPGPAAARLGARGDYRDIRMDVADGIAKLTICRPEVRNAFRPQTLFELSDAFNVARDDPSVGVVVLTGQGPDAFCSGGDQKIRGDDGYLGDDAVARQGIGRLNVLDLQIQIRRLPKPVVAMVAGYAIGGGHILHLVCDLTVAADNARFGQTGPKVGSFDGGYGASLLARSIGLKRAKEVWFLCRQYDAATAKSWGLVNEVVPAGRPRGRDRGLVPPDAVAVAAGAAHAEGRPARRRRRPGRAPAVRRRRHDALLHERGGPGGPQRLPGAPPAGLRPLPPPPVSGRRPGPPGGPAAARPIRKWWLGARPRTLPAALVPVVVGTAAAHPLHHLAVVVHSAGPPAGHRRLGHSSSTVPTPRTVDVQHGPPGSGGGRSAHWWWRWPSRSGPTTPTTTRTASAGPTTPGWGRSG